MSAVGTNGAVAGAMASAFDERAFRSKIPYKPDTKEHECYEALIPVLKARNQPDKPRIMVITDIEKDYDDLLAIIFLSEMRRLGVIELAGFVANHAPARERAKFLRSVVHLLGLGHLEVAVGTPGVENMAQTQLIEESYYELKNTTFANMEWNKQPFRSGAELMNSLAKEVDQGKEPLTVVLISSLQDISEYFESHKKNPGFLTRNFKKFVSQGGYTVTETNQGCSITPIKDITNNRYHLTAAKNYTSCLAAYNLPSDVWTREVAKAARLDGSTFTSLDDYGPIGAHLRWLYLRQEFKFYWDPFNAPYLPHLNAEWYLKTRLVLDPVSDLFAEMKASPPTFQGVLPLTKVIAYDGCAAMGAVGDDVMGALGIMNVTLPAHQHRVFGASETNLGGVDGARLGEVFKVFFFGALKATCQEAEKLIPSGLMKYRHAQYKVDVPYELLYQDAMGK